MFDRFRRSVEDALNSARSPGERRAAIAHMKETLALARVGLDDLRTGVRQARTRLEAERRELETVRRRRGLAQGIGDSETVAIAERYERHHVERVAVLTRKLEAQEGELTLAEGEVRSMERELEAALGVGAASGVSSSEPGEAVGGGAPSGSPTGAAQAGEGGARSAGDGGVDPDEDAAAREELDALARAKRRAAREAAAEERLAALKRRMGM
jgi:hypothetical protein